MNNQLYENCLLSYDKRKYVVFKEYEKKYIAYNQSDKKIRTFQIDKCILENQECCDYCYEICNYYVFIFIELKGRNLRKAAHQILSTINRICNNSDYYIHARIVCSKIHNKDERSSVVKDLKIKLAYFGGYLDYNSQILRENI